MCLHFKQKHTDIGQIFVELLHFFIFGHFVFITLINHLILSKKCFLNGTLCIQKDCAKRINVRSNMYMCLNKTFFKTAVSANFQIDAAPLLFNIKQCVTHRTVMKFLSESIFLGKLTFEYCVKIINV